MTYLTIETNLQFKQYHSLVFQIFIQSIKQKPSNGIIFLQKIHSNIAVLYTNKKKNSNVLDNNAKALIELSYFVFHVRFFRIKWFTCSLYLNLVDIFFLNVFFFSFFKCFFYLHPTF